MSGSAMLGDCRAFLRNGLLPPALLEPALAPCDIRLLQFIYEAGHDAGLDYRSISKRGTAVCLQHCAIQLADDLSDGDADYLAEAARLGPLLLMLLQNAFQAALSAAEISTATQRLICADLAHVGAGQLREIAREGWDASTAQAVAAALNGSQLSAYLRLTWEGTPLSGQAVAFGQAFGSAVHVVSDVASNDSRLFLLDNESQRAVLRWALEAAGACLHSQVPCMQRRAPQLISVLEARLAARDVRGVSEPEPEMQ